MSTLVTPNQSYLVKQMQARLAAAIGAIMNDLGDNVTGADDRPWKDNPYRTVYWPSGWRKDRQGWAFRRHQGSRVPISGVLFSKARWDAADSQLRYGDKAIDQNVMESDDSKSKVIRNDTDDPVHVAYEESVELTDSFSSSITKGVTLDMTEDAEVASEQKVGGEYMGVSAEVSVSEKFGISKSKSESTEEGREQSEEGTKAEKVAIEFDAAARTNYLVAITKEAEHTSQPFEIDGIMDFDFELDFRDPIGGRRIRGKVCLSGIDAFQQWLAGYDTDHPEMEGYRPGARAQEAADFLFDPANRRIRVSGISHGRLESNADYDVQELGSRIPDDMARLPVVDASDA